MLKWKKGRALHTRILWGLILGGSFGTFANWFLPEAGPAVEAFHWFLSNAVEPLGQVFLRMLFMIVVPLVFTSLTLGVAGLGDLGRLGRIGVRTFAYFLLVTTLGVVLGLTMVNTLKPGGHLDPDTRAALVAAHSREAEARAVAAPEFGVQTFVQIIPRNPIEAAARGDMLAVIFFSLMLGIALTLIPQASARPLLDVLEGLGKAVVAIIGLAMRLAPYGVFALIFNVTARFGWDILQQLLYYVLVTLSGLALFQFGVYAVLVRGLSGIPPLEFFKKARTVMITAFSTSSSSATLPTTMKTAEEELKVPREISGFVLPLGATMNMNGTALFEGVTVMFLAQVWGVDLSLGQQILVVILSVVSAIGAAGVPGGSIPLLVLILQIVGVPAEGIALVLGVDRILDMSRTVVNVTGDLTAAVFITRLEGRNSESRIQNPEYRTEQSRRR